MDKHRLLRRQLKKHNIDLSQSPDGFEGFLNSINEAYGDFDKDRLMIERSLELSSQELLQLNDEMQSIFDSAPDLYFKLKKEGDIYQVQGKSQGFYFYPRFKTPATLDDFEDPKLVLKLKSALNTLTETPQTLEFDFHAPLPHKTSYEFRCLPTQEGHFLVICRDITEQQQWKKLLIFHRIAQASMTETNFETTLEKIGQILSDSSDFEQIEIIYQPTHSDEHLHLSFPPMPLLPRELLTAFWKELEQTKEVKVYRRRENLDFKGETLLCAPLFHREIMVGALLFHAAHPTAIDDNFISWIKSVGNNIGQLISKQEMDLALLTSKEKALMADEAKSQFLTNMSHELRTPMNSIIGFSKILLKNGSQGFNEKEQLYIRRIFDNGEHLLSIINQILDLSKIEARQMNIFMESVRLQQLLEDVGAKLEAQFLEKEIIFDVDCSFELEPMDTDALKLSQILINLLSNAIKFTPQGGNVKLSVLAKEKKPTGISISDSGIGISSSEISLIFDAFHQVQGLMDNPQNGTGLGLTIAQSMCDLLGFELSVSSEPTKGTTFKILF